MELRSSVRRDVPIDLLSVLRYILVITILYIYFNSVFFRFLGEFVSQHILILIVPVLCLNSKMFLFLRRNTKIMGLYLLALLLTIVITFMGGDDQPLKNSILKIAYYLALPSILIPYICIHKLSISKCIIAIGWLSGVISTACFLSTDIANLMSDWFMNNIEKTDQLTQGRGFGIASGITYAYGLVNAFILAYSLSVNYYKKWYSILFYILIIFATVINTRTSFVIELLFILVFFLMNNSGNRIKFFIYLAIIIAVSYFYILPFIMNTDTGYWLTNGFFMFRDMLFDTNSASSNVFLTLEDMIIFPKTMSEWIFGTGKFIYEQSDIGFILQLYYGGLIYLGLLLITYYFTIKAIESKYMIICAIIMLLVANYKGVYLEYNDGLKVITFIGMYYAFLGYKGHKWLFASKH